MRSLPPVLELVDGTLSPPRGRLDGALHDPSTGQRLADRVASTTDAVEGALAAAVRVAPEWAAAGVDERAASLDALAERFAERLPAVAECDSLNSGVLHALTSAIAAGAPGQLRDAAEQLRRTGEQELHDGPSGTVRRIRAPWGPALVIGPWNAPTPTVLGKLASALAAGCPVILKPSEWAPSSASLLAEAAVEAGLPAGVLQVLHGDGAIGHALVGDGRVRVVAFTGSTTTARAIASAAAPHFVRCQLEGSGNNPAIVRADADIALTARSLAEGMVKLNGQWCEGPGKVLVHESRAADLVEALVAQLAGVRIGSAFDVDAQMGPIAYEAHRARLRAQVQHYVDLGGRAIAPVVDLPAEGWYLSPTVVTGVAGEAAHEEMFGPIVTVHPVPDDEEAVALAAGGGDGLAGFVFGEDVEAALSLGARLPGGEIRVNGTHLVSLAPDSRQSFWGSSGLGGHLTLADTLEVFRGHRIVGVDDPAAPI